MGTIKKIFNKLPLKYKIYFREHRGLLNINQLIKNNIQLQKKINEYVGINSNVLEIKDGYKSWEKAFKKFIVAQPSELEIAIEFFEDNIIKLKENDATTEKKVILICIVKNDLLKIKNMIEHHRKIGIKKFAIVDNNSTDGTKEWLIKQRDVDLFFTDRKYTTNKREAWINRIIAYYGMNRWYLILDSDELFVYKQMESKNIEEVITYCNEKKLHRIRALMIDMYAEDKFYENGEDKSYIQKCNYFDINTYEYQNRDILDLIIGGPRGRIFGQKAWLTKYPLCYFTKGDIQGKSHFPYPYIKNKNSKCLGALLHYKFLSSDIEKYRKIAYDGNYFNGSAQYKKYIEYIDQNGVNNFVYKNSHEYVNSESLSIITVLDEFEDYTT